MQKIPSDWLLLLNTFFQPLLEDPETQGRLLLHNIIYSPLECLFQQMISLIPKRTHEPNLSMKINIINICLKHITLNNILLSTSQMLRGLRFGKNIQIICIKDLLFWLCHEACGTLVPQPGIEPAPPAVEARSPNHWTAREVPVLKLSLYNQFKRLG